MLLNRRLRLSSSASVEGGGGLNTPQARHFCVYVCIYVRMCVCCVLECMEGGGGLCACGVPQARHLCVYVCICVLMCVCCVLECMGDIDGGNILPT